jgi:tripartite-type tricarboxylate transporter receptor subunit TctC
MDAVAKSAPDGYTLLFVASSGLTINPYVFDMPIDPLRDLMLVATATHTPFVLLANNDLPAKTLLEFLAHLKRPIQESSITPPTAATTILNCELLKARANVDYVDINYRGASQRSLLPKEEARNSALSTSEVGARHRQSDTNWRLTFRPLQSRDWLAMRRTPRRC